MVSLLSVFSASNRRRLLTVAVLITLGIAFADRVTSDYVALGFLYLFPIILVGGILSRWQIVLFGFLCAVLQELYGYLPGGIFPSLTMNSGQLGVAVPRLMFEAVGYIGTGLFVSEIVRNRRMILENLQEISNQVALRRDAENQLRALIESSPAAIVTVDASGKILLANDAARRLFCPGEQTLSDQSISSYVPSLYAAVRMNSSQVFRTTLQCKGQRSNGEVFLAGVWFSKYPTVAGQQLAAIVVDLSEDLRNWEQSSFDHLLKSTRILMSAVSHEIRNLCGAALVIHKNLRSVSALEGNEDFHALGSLIQGLERIAELELHPVLQASGVAIELGAVLDELRVLIETMCRESNIEVRWHTDNDLPPVWADHFSLLQAFLNIVKNSDRAMQDSELKVLQVSTSVEKNSVVVRFEDSGSGVQHPEKLFRPFQKGAESSGLGLYISRVMLKSFGAEMVFEPRLKGCCFAVILQMPPAAEAGKHA